jgi:hypothetical protein
LDADLTGAGSQDARDFVFWQILFRHKAEVMAAFVNVRFGGQIGHERRLHIDDFHRDF